MRASRRCRFGMRGGAGGGERRAALCWASRARPKLRHFTILTPSVSIFSMIRSFKDADTEALFRLGRVRRFANIERPALRRLKQLDLARRIEDMRAPPANRLEKLSGDRAGQWSVRINDQFRICFRWTAGGADDVEIVDYH